MELHELTPSHLETIRMFVTSEEFKDIKDAFIAHTPERGKEGREGDSDSKNLGKFLGTRFAFNEMEKLARKKPSTPEGETKKRGRSSGSDPDLES